MNNKMMRKKFEKIEEIEKFKNNLKMKIINHPMKIREMTKCLIKIFLPRKISILKEILQNQAISNKKK